MANAIYPEWKQSIETETDANNGLDKTDSTNGPYALLIDTTKYTYSALHQFYTDIPTAAILGTAQQITAPVLDDGLFSGANLLFTAVTGVVAAIIIYRPNAGATSTWRLVSYQDTGVVGFPFTSNGGNIVMRWDTAGIFQL